MSASIRPRRNIHSHRHDCETHIYAVGQAVRVSGIFIQRIPTASVFHITGKLPSTGIFPQYRIRNEAERYERVVTQDKLEPVTAPFQLAEGTLIERTFVTHEEETEGRRKAFSLMTDSNQTEVEKCAFAIDVWDSEGGAPAINRLDFQYGRRIEADRSWTVYHVFTGTPACLENHEMTGLSKAGATRRMLDLNRSGPTVGSTA